MGSNPIWVSVFSEFPFNDANIYLVVFLLDSLGYCYYNKVATGEVFLSRSLSPVRNQVLEQGLLMAAANSRK